MSNPTNENAPVAKRATWRGRLIPVGLVAAAVVLVALVAMMPNDKPPEAAAEVAPVNVSVMAVEARPELADTFALTAVVEANRVVRVAAEVAGRIERYGQRSPEVASRDQLRAPGMEIKEGDPVSQGDPIIHLNRALLEARFRRAQAQLDFDELEFGRITRLYKDATASKTELDDSRTNRDVSKALLDEAREELERTTVLAPISGTLNHLPMEIGEYASPGTCVAEIVDMDPAKIVVNVPERDVHYLKLGDTVTIFIRTTEEIERTGTITFISELSDESTRTTRVEITVENADHKLRSGQIVLARLTRRVLKDVIMIPLGAVIPLENGKTVYIVTDDNKAKRRDVELGFLKGRDVRIIRGLETGDRLIIAGHRYVGPGQPVTIVEEQ